jgi:hypothetical protein
VAMQREPLEPFRLVKNVGGPAVFLRERFQVPEDRMDVYLLAEVTAFVSTESLHAT